MILLPAIDIRDGKCVRLTQGDFDQETVYADDPVAMARSLADQGAQWIHVVDLDAALLGEPRNAHIVRAVIDAVDVKVQASGGIRSMEAIDAAVSAGASRVVVGTQALRSPTFVAEAVARFGEQVAVGLDVRGDRLQARGWTEDAGDLWEVLARLNDAGARRYVVTDVTTDGMLSGPNVDLLTKVMAATSAPVVASGGVSSLDDLRALAAAGAEACIVGKALYAGSFTLAEALTVT